jgi:hypothetical protein
VNGQKLFGTIKNSIFGQNLSYLPVIFECYT